MLDTRATERDIKGGQRERSEQRNFFLLKKYGREIGEEYDNALIKFDQDQKQLLAIDGKLEETLYVAKKEKSVLMKSKEESVLKYEQILWECAKMKQKLAAQQDKINIQKDKNEQIEEGQSLLKKENLMQLKEIEQRQAQRQDALQVLSSKLAQLKESEQKVALLRKANNDKRIEGRQLTLRIDDIEQQNLKILNKIGIIEYQIEEDTSCIENQLKKQGDLARKYGNLKRQKKELGGEVKQLTLQLQQEKKVNQQLNETEYNLSVKSNYIKQQIIENKQQIAELQSANIQQKSYISSNQDCLLKLQRHFSILKEQNKKVELYMQQILEQDYQIKSIIESKHKTLKTTTRQLLKDMPQNTCEHSLSSTMS